LVTDLRLQGVLGKGQECWKPTVFQHERRKFFERDFRGQRIVPGVPMRTVFKDCFGPFSRRPGHKRFYEGIDARAREFPPASQRRFTDGVKLARLHIVPAQIQYGRWGKGLHWLFLSSVST